MLTKFFIRLVPVPGTSFWHFIFTNNKQVLVDRLSISSLNVTYSGWPAKFNGCSRYIGGHSTYPFCSLGKHAPVHPGLGNFYHSTQTPLTTWSILITESTNSGLFKLSFAGLHFLRVLSIAKNYSLQPLQNTFTRFYESLLTVPGTKRYVLKGNSCPPSFPTSYVYFTWSQYNFAPILITQRFAWCTSVGIINGCETSETKVWARHSSERSIYTTRFLRDHSALCSYRNSGAITSDSHFSPSSVALESRHLHN